VTSGVSEADSGGMITRRCVLPLKTGRICAEILEAALLLVALRLPSLLPALIRQGSERHSANSTRRWSAMMRSHRKQSFRRMSWSWRMTSQPGWAVFRTITDPELRSRPRLPSGNL